MAYVSTYESSPLTREELDAIRDPVVVEFGTDWCGFCRGAQPLIAEAFAAQPRIRHLKIEDGQGRRLGRSFRVKLWPTLIFMRDGQELGRVVRPQGAHEIVERLALIARDTAAG